MNRKHEDTFLREGTEQITELNNALLALEEHPGDPSEMDRCFRSAHTLKGNFTAQGYEGARDLAHAMEDLLDDVRDGDLAVEPELMDQLFAGVDALEELLGEIEAGEHPLSDVGDLTDRLRTWRAEARADADPAAADGSAESGESAAACGSAEPGERADAGRDGTAEAAPDGDADDSPTLEGLQEALESGPVVRASVEFEPSEVPGADGTLVLERMTDQFDVVGTDPPAEAVEGGDHGGRVDVFVAGADPPPVRDAVSALPPVASATVTTIRDVDFSSDVSQTGAASEDEPDDATSSGPSTADDGAESSAPGLLGGLRSRLAAIRLAAGAIGGVLSVGASAGSAPAGTDPEATPSGERGDGGGDGDGGQPAGDGSADGPGFGGSSGTDPADRTGGSDEPGGPGGATGIDEISTVRVDVEQLDELYGLVERLVTSRIKLRNTFETADVDPGRDLDDLDKATTSLQDTVMEMRLVPMKAVVEKFPRLVRDLARDQDKEVSLEMSGTDVELDRSILDRVSDPLVHIVRNAVDHGIEPPDEREQEGKPREGAVELSARRERDTVVITIADDGRGIDPDEVRETALAEGIRTQRELDAMDDSTVYDLVFHPGFSTSEEVTSVSGRGVGMDVVRDTVSRLDGDVSVESTPGEGTEVTLTLPVSIAIVKVLFVEVDGDRYGIPIKKIARVTHFEGVETVNGTEVVDDDDGLTTVVRLHDALDTASPSLTNGDGMLVHVLASERPIALCCDDILDYEEVVVKPLDGALGGTPGLSGTAILGEGDVVPILDVMTI